MRNLFLLLCAFLTLGVDPPDDPVDPPEDADLPDLNADDPEDPDAVDPPADHDDPDAIREELKAERAARAAAEQTAREASERAAAAERARSAAPPAQSDEQKLFEQEEAVLRNPQATEQDKYWVNANRTLRANTRTSNAALHEARDLADRTEWSNLKASTPVLKKYEERVEKKLAEIRAGGNNLPRKVVAQLLIGEDIVGGKVKSTKRSAESTTTVARGKPASGRSDVQGRGGKTEHQKREARLANQRI